MELPILPTSIIGSYPKPRWLLRMYNLRELGRLPEEDFREAVRDASVAVLREHERAGIDIPWDGEMGRSEMTEYFTAKIAGFKFYGPIRVWGNAYFNKAAAVSKLEYREPLVLDEFRWVKENTTREIIKVPITGPYTIAEWSFNEYYSSKEELAFDLAKILNKEFKLLEKEGATFIQIDEPAMLNHPDEVSIAVEAINRAVKGVKVKFGLHVCYSNYYLLADYFDDIKVSQFALEAANRNFRDLDYLKKLTHQELGFGVVDVHNPRVESPEEVAKAIRKVMEYIEPERLYINPDCGLKLLDRRIAYQKLVNMVKGVEIVRRELAREGKTSIPFRREV
ncbi:methionine synthase II (cobalamin-independent) [Thermococcus kodakarensis KOD1]|uniref:Methionine synthase n=1 Tax=Thermococcus kodakarensis (strain ATCC BAA-918 / JCM 12380 / KOD1) TaxID=69014 RepID=METE_THEKO|nr:methionine synthase [Thermococcus kodakarensis]Q5JH51.1 RecName: Full=Methionine synthase; AltName: Full=Homocysteine methyltransferase [Thermococcus kodakarensis KOD1]WCN27417.1 methionine synthase [Thermococcus kodakarensis]WCN29707.1 methionine synthase [Thermococcus kodakarensis]BAD85635.1 methionine synthase II (cobalamin-independent) [Thermococcus kodakarensis KOD1]